MNNISFLLTLQAAGEEGGLFDFNATLPVTAVQILLLMTILDFLFYKPVSKVLNERDEYIRLNLTKASEILSKAESLTKQYELDLSQERRNAQTIISSAQEKAQDIVTIEITQTQKDTQQVVSEAIIQLNTQKEKVLKALESQVVVLSEKIKDKILSTKVSF